MNQEKARSGNKLMFVVTKSNFGGAQRYVLDLATGFKDTFDVSVVAGVAEGSENPGSLVEKLRDSEIRTIFIPAMQRDISALRDVRVFFAILRIFLKERPDIVHLNSSKAGGLGALAARLARIPRIIFTSHGLAYDEPRSRLARFSIYLVTWTTFLLSHSVICISTDTESRAKRLLFCKKKIRRIFNGSRAVKFLDRSEARERLSSFTTSISPDALWIGTISELVPNKGLAYSLHACTALKRTGKKFVFFIIGEGYLRSDIQVAIERRDLKEEVRLLGFIPNASSLLRGFDIFTLTSRKEGLPYVLLEAGQAQLAVAGTDIPGIRDIVDDGISGTLSPIDDPDRFADSIEELISDEQLREKLGSSLNIKVLTSFSFENMVNETEQVYLSIERR